MCKFIFVIMVFFSVPALGDCEKTSWEKYKNETFAELSNIEGWCKKEKAEILMNFIYQFHPKLCVEIGTYGGSTTYPLARALAFTQSGSLYTIDAWDNSVAIEGMDSQWPCIQFWSAVDMKGTHDRFVKMVVEKHIGSICLPIQGLSEKVVDNFSNESIDFLYIDGNFSTAGTLLDVLLYLPKVKKGGYIWLTNPLAKERAVAILMGKCTWSKDLSSLPDWIVFKNEPESSFPKK